VGSTLLTATGVKLGREVGEIVVTKLVVKSYEELFSLLSNVGILFICEAVSELFEVAIIEGLNELSRTVKIFDATANGSAVGFEFGMSLG